MFGLKGQEVTRHTDKDSSVTLVYYDILGENELK